MRRFCIAVLGCCVALGAAAKDYGPKGPEWAPALLSAEEMADGFYPLFDGADLDGWWISGSNKGAFAVKEGALVTTGQGNGGWLFTNMEYENFVLRYEYRVFKQDDNSGVAIRATKEGNPAFSGMEIQVLHPETEPRLGSAGALYGSVKPAVAADKPFGEWNEVEVLCDGPRIRTIMNGQTLYDIDINTFESPDKEHSALKDRAKCGHIALQDYGKQVEFRKLRLKPLPGGEGWRPLFNGKDLTGWKVMGDSKWSVKDGYITVNNLDMTVESGIRTEQEYADFEFRVMARAHKNSDGGANSGVIIRGRGDDPWPDLYEVQIDNHDPEEFTGAIWDYCKASELRTQDECWFQMIIRAKGPNIQVAVNGKTVVDYLSPKHAEAPSGWLLLQGHDAKSVVDFKDIEIREIK